MKLYYLVLEIQESSYILKVINIVNIKSKRKQIHLFYFCEAS